MEAIDVLLGVAVLVYVGWQGYRALRGAHHPKDALWFIGRVSPPANDPPPRPLSREDRRRERAFRGRER